MAGNDTRELGQFIPLHYHYNMLMDSVRMAGFRAAIDHVLKPGATVLELGGGTGVLSFFAAQKAKKVFCVELNLDLVDEARRLLRLNSNGDRVEVIHADGFEYLPPEPVDAVICEMLHVGLLREKQLEMIDAFKKRYQQRFDGCPLPVFIPEATLQAVQPVQQDFNYEGYYAPVVQFQHPYCEHPQTKVLGEPVVYHQVLYDQPFGYSCKWSGYVPITADGTVNALRVITRNFLAIAQETQSVIDWHNQYMVQPLGREVEVRAGQRLTVSFDYSAGEPLSAFCPVVVL